MFPAPQGAEQGFEVPENGDAKRPEPPSPDEYEKLRREADELRRTKLSDQSPEAVRRRDLQRGMGNYVRYTGIGMQFLLIMLLPVGLGYWLDDWLGTSPALILVGAGLGAVGAMTYVVKSVFKLESKEKKDK